MRYAIKQRMMAFGEDFDVFDEDGRKVYFIDGKAASIGHHLVVKDTRKQVLARIKQVFGRFSPTYKIVRGGQTLGRVYKKLFTFAHRFVIDIPGYDYEVVGSPLRWDYKFMRNKRQVGRVNKKLLSFRDAYGLEIEEGEDEIALLCCAIVIDMVLHNKKSKYNRNM